MPDVTEWEFTADIASSINEILRGDPSLPFYRAKCEQRGRGSRKRRDLTLLDKERRVCLTGEVKLPYRKDGGSPFVEAVVNDARKKAQRAQARFFFTWNVNQCVLWETTPSKTSLKDREYQSWNVTSVSAERHMSQPMTAHAIQYWLPLFLTEFARILRGTFPIGVKSPDEKFIEALESSLSMPIMLTIEELTQRYKQNGFRAELDRWMRDEQGWVIRSDPEGIRDNLDRAAKFSCYALVNKLIFHEALLKRYKTKMDRLEIPEHMNSGDSLRQHLEGYFAKAKEITGDYETVFGEEHMSIGNRIPFYCDRAAVHWRVLINQIHEFDFSKLDYEIIGNVFERLIGPEERHKYGQFYTRVEVVDLINSFCIVRGDEKVMDPACGGGTFLVRAYARKKELAPARKHGQRLQDLYGVDVSHFATHLTTINLATRDLIDDENYPQIVRSDFFDVHAGHTFVVLPNKGKSKGKSKGLGKTQHREVDIPLLDAVVGNPPYIRQEAIRKAKRKGKQGLEPGTKQYYQQLVKEKGAALSGRSDIHCYFWPHAASFLKKDGYLCLLTSSQWLDVEYGFQLQEWILRNFEIVALFESIDEPWFVGARVATTVTILRRQPDEGERMKNIVRFIQLRRPIAEILAHDGTTAGAVTAADAFRDEILWLNEETTNRRYRARLVRQGELWRQGVQLGITVGKSKDHGGDDPDKQTGDYFGGKWGVHLRAPNLLFELLDGFGGRLSPLGSIAEIRRGITSGRDHFFFPKDSSKECLQSHDDLLDFERIRGVPREKVESGEVKLVLCGEGRGEIRPIESEYLEPEVHSLMEVGGFDVSPEDCARQMLLVGKSRDGLKGTYVLDYIEWGEEQGYDKGATCAARVTQDREWYDLTGHERGALFWPKAQQYKHAIPLNEQHLQCNCNLYDIHVPDRVDRYVMAGILNSSLVVLLKFQYGRPVGVEGNLKTEVVDVKMMLVPDPTKASASTRQRVARAFAELKKRPALQFLSERRLREMAYGEAGKEHKLKKLSDECELDMPDRHELDDAVLAMLGVRSKRRRQELIRELYTYLYAFFEWVREKEEKAIANKKKAKRRGPAKASEIAAQIHQDLVETDPKLLRKYEPDFIDTQKPFDTYEVPGEGVAELLSDMLIPHGVRFRKGKKTVGKIIETRNAAQAKLLTLVVATARRIFPRVPYDEDECERVLRDYEEFVRSRDRRIRQLIEECTADEEMQGKIYEALMLILMNRKADLPARGSSATGR